MPVLDTNFLIALKAREPAAVALLESIRDQELIVPSVVAAEYLVPFGAAAEAAFLELRTSFQVSHTNPEWVLLAARMRLGFRGKRSTFRPADFWVAVWASLHRTSVVTRNQKDFEPLGVPTTAW